MYILRGSHWGCSIKKGVLKNFAKLTGKHLCQSLFFNKIAGLSHPGCFTEHPGWLLLFPRFHCITTLLQNTKCRLLQNATKLYLKIPQLFYYKMRQSVSQNASGLLLQKATVQKQPLQCSKPLVFCKKRCS